MVVVGLLRLEGLLVWGCAMPISIPTTPAGRSPPREATLVRRSGSQVGTPPLGGRSRSTRGGYGLSPLRCLSKKETTISSKSGLLKPCPAPLTGSKVTSTPACFKAA